MINIYTQTIIYTHKDMHKISTTSPVVYRFCELLLVQIFELRWNWSRYWSRDDARFWRQRLIITNIKFLLRYLSFSSCINAIYCQTVRFRHCYVR